MIDLNMRALTALSLVFMPSLERHQGGILNVGSMAGFLPGPGMAVYYASKAYVRSFSDALHAELEPRGIRVTNLAPGPVPTEFGERAGVEKDQHAVNDDAVGADHVAEARLSRLDGGETAGRAGHGSTEPSSDAGHICPRGIAAGSDGAAADARAA